MFGAGVGIWCRLWHPSGDWLDLDWEALKWLPATLALPLDVILIQALGEVYILCQVTQVLA